MGPSVSGKEEDASRTSVKNSKEGEEEREEDFHLTDEDKDTSWMAHALCFAKDERGKDLMQRQEKVDDYVVLDPRVRQAIEERKQRENRSKESQTERIYAGEGRHPSEKPKGGRHRS